MKDKVIYQIYPKSFYDSNGDGFGDLNGIIDKLDYLQYLGIDMIWINPIYPSPQNDNGYDIENYYDIDPMFGTMKDFEKLVKEASDRGIGIMMDMVLNHTSTNHPWFQKALQNDPEYKDRYIFRKGHHGKPPTNWKSKFEGSAWYYVKDMDEYYLRLFHETQADLNWKNEKVREEAANIVNFWIQKGVKGFRFDVINLIDKESFTNDDSGDGKRFYTDRPMVHTYLQELNQHSFGQYDDIITVGEFSSTSIENCIKYTGESTHELSMAFSFHHLKVDYDGEDRWKINPFDFMKLKRVLTQWQIGLQEGKGWNALFWCCHDQPRVLSRYGDDKNYPKESAKMLATALHMLRGTPYIYQGEEIGMSNAYFDEISQYRDIAALNSYEVMKEQGRSEDEIFHFLQSNSRDNARTPMQWNAETYAGFTKGKPWIDCIQNYKEVNVENSLKDLDSVFFYYRKLIQLRKEHRVIQEGEFVPILEEHPNIFAYKRVLGEEEIVVYNNFFDQPVNINVEIENSGILLSNVNRQTLTKEIKLLPYESLVIQRNIR